MSEPLDEARLAAIQAVADKADAACRTAYEQVFGDVDPTSSEWMRFEDAFRTQLRDIANTRALLDQVGVLQADNQRLRDENEQLKRDNEEKP